MANKRILVTGASGYIAGKLIPRLLEAGYLVRCMVRDANKIAHHPWIGEVEVVIGNVSMPETLPAALHQVNAAYYLIHNMSSGHGYQKIEREGAENFAQAAHQEGAEHIIYLGGLADPHAKIAPHMRSRIETGKVLRQHPVPVTEFRAGVIVGPGSISFEMIRFMCEQFPILVGPSWLKNRTQPISAENVIDYLMAALENENGRGQIFEIGGPDTFTYGETMLLYGEIRQLRRRLLTVPTLPTTLMANIVDKLTPIPASIAYPLIEGLNSNSIITDPKATDVFPEVKLSEYNQAVKQALNELHPKKLERIWIDRKQPHVSLRSEGFLIEFHEVQIAAPAREIVPHLLNWINRNLETYQSEETPGNNGFLFKEIEAKNGLRWMGWELLPQSEESTLLRQTGYFAPKGLAGFLSSLWWRLQQRRIFKQISNFFRE